MKKTYPFHQSMQYILLALAIIFLVIGVLREEPLTVLRKAINVCLECIGIG